MSIEVIKGDITTLTGDAVVNAAAPQLLGGGGVDGALHRAAGPDLLAECEALPADENGVRCPTGHAKITGSHDLTRYRHVIHTVGPIFDRYTPEEACRLLASCYIESLKLARDTPNVNVISIPAISTGVYGFPIDLAARVAITACLRFQSVCFKPGRILLVAFDEPNFNALMDHSTRS